MVYEVPPLKWFRSYLSGRQHFTEIDDTLSGVGEVKCGVPHLYINDIVNSSSLLKFFLFADDTTIFFSSKPSSTIEKTLNTELN